MVEEEGRRLKQITEALGIKPADKVSKYLLSVSVTVKHLESSDSMKVGCWVRRGAVGKAFIFY